MKVTSCKMCWKTLWGQNTCLMALSKSKLADWLRENKWCTQTDWRALLPETRWESFLLARIQDLCFKTQFLKRHKDPGERVRVSGFFYGRFLIIWHSSEFPCVCLRQGGIWLCIAWAQAGQGSEGTRQWPEVSDFVARFCTLRKSENTRTCENCTHFCTHFACNSRMSVCFLTCATWKKVWHESYTSGHWLEGTIALTKQNKFNHEILGAITVP